MYSCAFLTSKLLYLTPRVGAKEVAISPRQKGEMATSFRGEMATPLKEPLDRAFFKALKSYFYKAVNTWQKQNVNRKVSRLQFGQLLSDAWGKSATPENAISGFRGTGIFPLNPNAVPEYAFVEVEQTTHESQNIGEVPECCRLDSSVENIGQSTGQQAVQRAMTPQPSCSWQNVSELTPSKLLKKISPVPKISKTSATSSRRKIGALELKSVENIEKIK